MLACSLLWVFWSLPQNAAKAVLSFLCNLIWAFCSLKAPRNNSTSILRPFSGALASEFSVMGKCFLVGQFPFIVLLLSHHHPKHYQDLLLSILSPQFLLLQLIMLWSSFGEQFLFIFLSLTGFHGKYFLGRPMLKHDPDYRTRRQKRSWGQILKKKTIILPGTYLSWGFGMVFWQEEVAIL